MELSARTGVRNLYFSLGSSRKHHTGGALRPKSLLGHARQPLGSRNHCSGVLLRSDLALESAASAFGIEQQSKILAQRVFFCTFRCSHVFRSHLAFEIADGSSYFAFDSTRKHSSRAVDSHRRPLRVRQHGSSVLRNHLALESLLEQAS